MTVMLHAIEALAGAGRYSVVFRYPDGSSQTAVVQADDASITAAEASLPVGWTAGSAEYLALAEAVLALHRARSAGPQVATLEDVDGGWDVMLGNVVLGADAAPACTAHGPLAAAEGDVWECFECGAKARFAG
ncbi:MAG: hypothetical protein ACTHMS_18470 [Jatrophihabitans sp.]|uniref:hypothetical protein n=1 Tax=Jatrophihabitans sp. TaxID=1932789 RepID=UPI003F7DBB80